MTTPPPESVEQLAESLARYANERAELQLPAYADSIAALMKSWLRDVGIDPDTMRAGEPEPDIEQMEKSMEYYKAGKSQDVQEVIDELQQPPPTEPVVTVYRPTEREMQLADEIAGLAVSQWGVRMSERKRIAEFANAITRHNAAEREELQRVKKQLSNEKNTVAHQTQRNTDLQSQLAESQKRVKELEQLLISGNATIAQFMRELSRLAGLATQPSHEGRDGT